MATAPKPIPEGKAIEKEVLLRVEGRNQNLRRRSKSGR